VLPVVFLSVGPSLIAVGFGSTFQLLSRGFFVSLLMVEEGGRWKREKEGEHCRHDGTGFRALKYCLSDPQGRLRRMETKIA
jgi:hypothetical protein